MPSISAARQIKPQIYTAAGRCGLLRYISVRFPRGFIPQVDQRSLRGQALTFPTLNFCPARARLVRRCWGIHYVRAHSVDDLTKILLTSSLTALGAMVVFVASQIVGKLVIEPVQDLKKLLGEIQFALIFHAQAALTPVGDRDAEDKAAEAFRKLACDLRWRVAGVPFYDFWAKLSRGFLPKRQNRVDASKNLIGLSNSVHDEKRWDRNPARIERIQRLLGIDPLEE
jgi:hypothetical protein